VAWPSSDAPPAGRVQSPGKCGHRREARDEFGPYYLEVIRSVGKTRGFAPRQRNPSACGRAARGAVCRVGGAVAHRRSRRIWPTLGREPVRFEYGMEAVSRRPLICSNIELVRHRRSSRVASSSAPKGSELGRSRHCRATGHVGSGAKERVDARSSTNRRGRYAGQETATTSPCTPGQRGCHRLYAATAQDPIKTKKKKNRRCG